MAEGASAKSKDSKSKEEKPPSASFRELYQYTSWGELALLAVGFTAALGGGIAQPMMLIAFSTLFKSTSW